MFHEYEESVINTLINLFYSFFYENEVQSESDDENDSWIYTIVDKEDEV
jgi:hypothetical protein